MNKPIKCVGRRSFVVELNGGMVALGLNWKGERLATPQLEKADAIELVKELEEAIGKAEK